MAGKLVSSTQTTVDNATLDLSIKKSTLKKLDGNDAGRHLAMLSSALTRLEALVKEKLTAAESRNRNLLLYLQKLSAMLAILNAKDILDTLVSGELKNSLAIHPTDSGFPLFIRDLGYLAKDQSKAESQLATIPADEELVDAALFSLFRGQFPQDTINRKYARIYWEGLNKAEIPASLKILDEMLIEKRNSSGYYCKAVERLDETGNLPLLYSIYFRVPEGFGGADWKMELPEAIRSGLGTAISIELPYLARQIEAIDGVMLDMLDRYTIGPFYNRFTENSGAIADLITEEDDYIMMIQKNTVLRVAEQKHKGLLRSIAGLISGDRTLGVFAPTLASVRHVLMPYRMLQKALNKNIPLGENVKLYGFTKEGGIID